MGAGDLNSTTDPDGQKRAAWVKDSMARFALREAELAKWRGVLAEAIALGIVRCDDVVRYNREAISNYEWATDFYRVIGTLISELRQRGYNLMPGEVPYPQLIGTRFQVSGAPNGRTFDYGLLCTSTGDFSPLTPRSALILGPAMPQCAVGGGGGQFKTQGFLPSSGGGEVATTRGGTIVYSPYESIESLSSGLAGPVAVCSASFLAIFFCLGALLTFGYLANVARDVVWAITGTDKARIDAKLYERKLEQERKRAEFWLECMKAKTGIASGAQISEADKKAYGDDCAALAEKTYPDTQPPYSGTFPWWMWPVLGVGGVAIALAAIRSRRARADD